MQTSSPERSSDNGISSLPRTATSFAGRCSLAVVLIRWLRRVLRSSFRTRPKGVFALGRLLRVPLQLLWLIGPWTTKGQSSPNLLSARLKRCIACPMFDAKLLACGSPGDTWNPPGKTDRETLGCWCFMPLKSRMLAANCWAWENYGDGMGWPNHMNGEVILESRRRRNGSG